MMWLLFMLSFDSLCAYLLYYVLNLGRMVADSNELCRDNGGKYHFSINKPVVPMTWHLGQSPKLELQV